MFNGCVCTYITHILTYWEKLSTLCVGYVVSSNDTNRYWRNKIRITHHHHIIHYQRNGFVNHFYLCVNVRSSCVHTHTFFVSSLHSTDSTAVRILYTSQWLLLLLLLLMVMVMASKAVKKKCEPRQSGRYTEPDSTMFSCSHSYSVCSTHATGKIFSPIIIRARLL